MTIDTRRTPITRRTLLKTSLATTALVGAGPAIIGRAQAADNSVIVNTWGGIYTAAQDEGYFKPFTKATGIEVKTATPVSFAKLKAQVQSGNYEWDVTSTGPIDYVAGMKQGLVEPLDWTVIDRSKITPSAIGVSGIQSQALATTLVYQKKKFPNGGPQSWADFWDVKKFPGARGLCTDEVYSNIGFALLADGVPKDKLYPLDLDRGFKKLDQIKPHIKVWWSQGSQSEQLMRDGEVDMMSMWNGRSQALVDAGVPVEIVWNEAQTYFSYWYVAKGSPRAKNAMKFIEFAAQGQGQAIFGSKMFYGPSNPKAFEFLTKADAEKMPTSPEHSKISFTPDNEWLGENLDRIKERWNQWIAA